MISTCTWDRNVRDEDAMETLRRLFAQLRLRINESKSAVAWAWERNFLSYRFWLAPGPVIRPRVAPASPGGDESPRAGHHAPQRRPKSDGGGRGVAELSHRLGVPHLTGRGTPSNRRRRTRRSGGVGGEALGEPALPYPACGGLAPATFRPHRRRAAGSRPPGSCARPWPRAGPGWPLSTGLAGCRRARGRAPRRC